MKSAKKAASAKPQGSKTGKKRATKRRATKKAAKKRIAVSPEGFEGDIGDSQQLRIKELLQDVQRIFVEAMKAYDEDNDGVVEVTCLDLTRLTGVCLALASQLHEVGQQDTAKILEGAWTMAAGLVDKLGGEVVVSGDDLEKIAGMQLKRETVGDNAIKMYLVESEEVEKPEEEAENE